MPLCYGGGVNDLKQIDKILYSGVEKVCINTAAVENEFFIKEAAKEYGSSTIVVSIDVRKQLFGGYKIYTHSGSKKCKLDPLSFSKKMEDLGAGEILLNSIDKDGTMSGFDNQLIKLVASQVNIPVVAAGGAGSIEHFKEVLIQGKASAVAAGSYFVFQGKHNAVLITYPDKKEINQFLK